MTDIQKLELMRDRLLTLSENPKNIKCPGTVKKLRRQVRNMEKKLNI